jgi:hypothetical protein
LMIDQPAIRKRSAEDPLEDRLLRGRERIEQAGKASKRKGREEGFIDALVTLFCDEAIPLNYIKAPRPMPLGGKRQWAGV